MSDCGGDCGGGDCGGDSGGGGGGDTCCNVDSGGGGGGTSDCCDSGTTDHCGGGGITDHSAVFITHDSGDFNTDYSGSGHYTSHHAWNGSVNASSNTRRKSGNGINQEICWTIVCCLITIVGLTIVFMNY